MHEQASTKGVPVLAVDTGGTFTDLILLQEGYLTSLKVPSTPHDPSEAVLSGVRRLVDPGQPFLLLHGSTVATNALLERKGARVYLVTNAGFEDVIEIGRQNRPQLYALVGHRLPPLVDAEHRIGLAGRLGPDGAELTRMDEAQLDGLAESIVDAEAVAVCLLHSYANSAHEDRVSDALAALEVPVSISSRLIPEYREYERTSTTVINAYVAPLMRTYLGRIAEESNATRVAIMGSNGGTLSVTRAQAEPAHTVLSGPAGGVVGASEWGRRAGSPDVITFDMGGTSTDVSLCPGHLLHTREFEIAGHPVALPMLDIHTVGAGGGSLARIDAGGVLQVGPQSAGADPGPICYGRGGTGVTVTDAHVWLGRLPLDAFLGGGDALDREAIRPHMTQLAEGLSCSPEEAAEGVLDVANSAMERALRVISVERGFDPVAFSIVAFGGAGGLHVTELAERLGALQAIVPPDPGLLSAYGMLAAPVSKEVSRTVLVSTDVPDGQARIEAILEDLSSQAADALIAEGTRRQEINVERQVDARYRGQSFELRVPFEGWVPAFHAAHKVRYGYERQATPVEAVTVRAVATTPGPTMAPAQTPERDGPLPTRTGEVWHRGELKPVTRVRRVDLTSGDTVSGPCIVEEYSSTTWVPPRWRLNVDQLGVLLLTREES